jgi:hypothetical protein
MPGTGQSRIWILRNGGSAESLSTFTGSGGLQRRYPSTYLTTTETCFWVLHMHKSRFTGIVFCTWFALQHPTTVSTEEIERFSKLYRNDARPTQPLYDRIVLESQCGQRGEAE